MCRTERREMPAGEETAGDPFAARAQMTKLSSSGRAPVRRHRLRSFHPVTESGRSRLARLRLRLCRAVLDARQRRPPAATGPRFRIRSDR